MGRWKFFNTFLTAMMLTLGCAGMTASAEEAKDEAIPEEAVTESISDEETETEEISESERTTNPTEPPEESSLSENTTETTSNEVLNDFESELIQEITEDSEKESSYCDIDGNASLIKSEKIIYDTEEMQFIAVTTKDGNVFYILINYSADEENSVYFLNKVDTFDLYSLLYMTDEEEENGIDIERAKQAEEAALHLENFEESESTEDTDLEIETEETPVQQTGSSNILLYLLFGAIALGGIGFAGFKFLKKSKQKPVIAEMAETEEEEDFDFYDGEEVNEDNE